MRKELKFRIIQMLDGDVDLKKHLETLKPSLIVIDLDSMQPSNIISLIKEYPGFSFLGINHSTSQIITFESNHYPINSMHEFCQLAQTGLNQNLHRQKGGFVRQEKVNAVIK